MIEIPGRILDRRLTGPLEIELGSFSQGAGRVRTIGSEAHMVRPRPGGSSQPVDSQVALLVALDVQWADMDTAGPGWFMAIGLSFSGFTTRESRLDHTARATT